MANVESFSEYYKSLAPDVAERYKIKIVLINNEDPYPMSKEDLVKDFSVLPKITYLHYSTYTPLFTLYLHYMVQYLVYNKSFYTAEDFKAHKSFESYNQFVLDGLETSELYSLETIGYISSDCDLFSKYKRKTIFT